MPLLPYEQRSPEWYAARAGLVTASVAAAILNIGPNGRLWAYNQIVGPGQPDNKHMAWGRAFEATARAAYECRTGLFVEPTGFWVHPTQSWLGASPDGLVEEDGLVEIKCPGTIPTAIPEHHVIQMRVQLACTDRHWCDYYAWSQEGEFLARIERDYLAERSILHQLNTFWAEHVEPRIAPTRSRREKTP